MCFSLLSMEYQFLTLFFPHHFMRQMLIFIIPQFINFIWENCFILLSYINHVHGLHSVIFTRNLYLLIGSSCFNKYNFNFYISYCYISFLLNNDIYMWRKTILLKKSLCIIRCLNCRSLLSSFILFLN